MIKRSVRRGGEKMMNKILSAVNIIFLVVCVVYFCWRVGELDQNFQKEMHEVGLLISKYEAKAQFINKYLPMVEEYTKSGIIAKRILAAVYENSLWCQLNPELILAVITVESQFYPRAKSNVGAIGLMQVMPLTGIYVGRSLGIYINSDEDLFEVETNIQIGCVFLKDCIWKHGEFNGKGFYYAGRYEKHYQEYNDKIAAAKVIWETENRRNGEATNKERL
jgi:hypothetical protein